MLRSAKQARGGSLSRLPSGDCEAGIADIERSKSSSLSSTDPRFADDDRCKHDHGAAADGLCSARSGTDPATVYAAFCNPRAVFASWKCKFQLSPLSVIIILSAGLLLTYLLLGTFATSNGGGNDSLGSPYLSKIDIDRYFFIPPSVRLPVTGVVATHHRSGTVLFQNLGERLCTDNLVDYMRVEEPFNLQTPDKNDPTLYQRYYSATETLVVAMHGFQEMCPKGDSIWSYCGMLDGQCWMEACKVKEETTMDTRRGLPLVHVVRNPMEVLISAYFYHQMEPPPEEWLYNPKPDALTALPEELQKEFVDIPYHKALQQLPPEWGIVAEFTLECQEIYQMARNYRDMAQLPYALNVHFEDIVANYSGTMDNILHHLGIMQKFGEDYVRERASIFDLPKMPLKHRIEYHVEEHVTEGKFDKKLVRNVVYNNSSLRNVLNMLAEVMDYPTSSEPAVRSEQEPSLLHYKEKKTDEPPSTTRMEGQPHLARVS